ncbi:hypothetical protein EVAR_45822_1 [Eumeta japonica]|uniref:Uncharacterized protein n=1 Tax=Eumeta variegata TaxID=151549 RepID=A0A4C1WLT1_EUMVA|nr:hypothetical protein EVAR_45822_1 [Eumeta japonica]
MCACAVIRRYRARSEVIAPDSAAVAVSEPAGRRRLADERPESVALSRRVRGPRAERQTCPGLTARALCFRWICQTVARAMLSSVVATSDKSDDSINYRFRRISAVGGGRRTSDVTRYRSRPLRRRRVAPLRSSVSRTRPVSRRRSRVRDPHAKGPSPASRAPRPAARPPASVMIHQALRSRTLQIYRQFARVAIEGIFKMIPQKISRQRRVKFEWGLC